MFTCVFQREAIRFLHDGQRIGPDATPGSVRMKIFPPSPISYFFVPLLSQIAEARILVAPPPKKSLHLNLIQLLFEWPSQISCFFFLSHIS